MTGICVSSMFTQTIGMSHGETEQTCSKSCWIKETSDAAYYTGCDHNLSLNAVTGCDSFDLDPETAIGSCDDDGPLVLTGTKQDGQYVDALLIEGPAYLGDFWMGYNIKHTLSNTECSVNSSLGAAQVIKARTRLSITISVKYGHYESGNRVLEDTITEANTPFVRSVLGGVVTNPCVETEGEWAEAVNTTSSVAVSFITTAAGDRPESQCAYCAAGRNLLGYLGLLSTGMKQTLYEDGIIDVSSNVLEERWVEVIITMDDASDEEAAEYISAYDCQCDCCN